MDVIDCSAVFRFSVLSLTSTNFDLRKLKGLWTSVTSCDLNALCRRSEKPGIAYMHDISTV